MRTPLLAGLGLVLALAAASPAPAAAKKLLGIRSAPWEDRYRIVLDLSETTTYRSRVLTGPDRVVIEVPRTSIAGATMPVIKQKMVTGLSVTALADSTARVVIGLSGPLRCEVFTVAPGDGKPFRIVCDIYRPVPGAPAPKPKAVAPAPAPAVPAKTKWVVEIDPGHGGRDPGAGQRLAEKTITLDVARRLAERLNQEPGVMARLTRRADVRVGLKTRVRRAEDAGADAFVSVHVNGCKDRSARGAEVFFLSLAGASDAAGREVEALENAPGDAAEDTTLSAIAQLPFGVDLLQTDTMRRSSLLAESILGALEKSDLAASRGVKQANFVVLRSARIPSALVEVGFISNPGDADRLASPAHREALAVTIAQGLLEYRARYARQSPGGE
jgi:N-acetylmuramoyl-L-alanine amidase